MSPERGYECHTPRNSSIGTITYTAKQEYTGTRTCTQHTCRWHNNHSLKEPPESGSLPGKSQYLILDVHPGKSEYFTPDPTSPASYLLILLNVVFAWGIAYQRSFFVRKPNSEGLEGPLAQVKFREHIRHLVIRAAESAFREFLF